MRKLAQLSILLLCLLLCMLVHAEQQPSQAKNSDIGSESSKDGSKDDTKGSSKGNSKGSSKGSSKSISASDRLRFLKKAYKHYEIIKFRHRRAMSEDLDSHAFVDRQANDELLIKFVALGRKFMALLHGHNRSASTGKNKTVTATVWIGPLVHPRSHVPLPETYVIGYVLGHAFLGTIELPEDKYYIESPPEIFPRQVRKRDIEGQAITRAIIYRPEDLNFRPPYPFNMNTYFGKQNITLDAQAAKERTKKNIERHLTRQKRKIIKDFKIYPPNNPNLNLTPEYNPTALSDLPDYHFGTASNELKDRIMKAIAPDLPRMHQAAIKYLDKEWTPRRQLWRNLLPFESAVCWLTISFDDAMYHYYKGNTEEVFKLYVARFEELSKVFWMEDLNMDGYLEGLMFKIRRFNFPDELTARNKNFFKTLSPGLSLTDILNLVSLLPDHSCLHIFFTLNHWAPASLEYNWNQDSIHWGRPGVVQSGFNDGTDMRVCRPYPEEYEVKFKDNYTIYVNVSHNAVLVDARALIMDTKEFRAHSGYWMMRTLTNVIASAMGAPEDTPDSECGKSGLSVMSKKSWERAVLHAHFPIELSACSRAAIKETLFAPTTSCLRRVEEVSQSCGNGIVDYLETCDYGSSCSFKYNCCDPRTCRWYLDRVHMQNCTLGKISNQADWIRWEPPPED